MDIKGIQKTSLVDYPGKISSVLFFGGCNFSCGYCHNPDLVRGSNDLRTYSESEILEFLKNRSSLIDGVVVTGGEPTLYKDIESFIQTIKDIPLYVKIDTNGSNPSIIEKLLKKSIVDYIAIDIKSSPEKYELAAGVKVNTDLILDTVKLVKDSGVDYELRTTCAPPFVSSNDFIKIKEWIGSVKKYYLQQFVNKSTLDHLLNNCTPYTAAVLYEFQDIIMTFADVCEVRGI
jgi:pyruvate formate lyase activating enzyme